MKVITDISSATGADSKDVGNWLSRIEFRTRFEPTRQGRARRYSLENALEVAFVDACTKGGARPSRAVAMAHRLVTDCLHSRHLRPWMIFVAGEADKGLRFETFNPSSVLEINPGANAFALIPVGAIYERVRAYFDANAVEEV